MWESVTTSVFDAPPVLNVSVSQTDVVLFQLTTFAVMNVVAFGPNPTFAAMPVSQPLPVPPGQSAGEPPGGDQHRAAAALQELRGDAHQLAG